MIIVQTKKEMDEYLNLLRNNSEKISLVPTMGNLHEGHLSLIDLAKKNSSKVIVSIFVNPLQFGKNEDFNKYPRTLKEDKIKLIEKKCDLLFCPKTEKEIFLNKNKIEIIKSGKLGEILCGLKRPGHFDGVLTLVHQLFSIIKPEVAVFGAKDYQQQFLIKKMSNEIFPNLKIIIGPIIRDENGLALSSRNFYLSKKERKIAPFFFKSLKRVVEKFKDKNDLKSIQKETKILLSKKGIEVEYLEIRDTELNLLNNNNEENKKILLGSIKLGTTKLIDNIEFF